MSLPNSFIFSNRFYGLLCAFLLGSIAFAQYANTFGHEYVLDDVIVIEMNKNVKKGISGIPSLIKNYHPKSLQVQNNYGYRPVTLISFAIDISLFGQDPKYGHIANALYFSLLCIIIFFTLRLLFPYHTYWLPFLASLLFAVHPIHSEVVANIKSRDEILSLLFCLLALQSALQYVHKQKIIHYFLFSMFFLLALFSKEQALLFSFIIPIALVIFSNVSLQKFKTIVITLASLFALRWFIGLHNNIPFFLSIFAVIGCNFLFYYFYKAKIQSFSALKQSSKDSLNIWKQQINSLENRPQLLQSLFIITFLLALVVVFFEKQWFVILISVMLLTLSNSLKPTNKSLLLVLGSILFTAYATNNHSSAFIILNYFIILWLFAYYQSQFKSKTPFIVSFLFIAASIITIIDFPYSILSLAFIPLFVFSFRQRKTMIAALITLFGGLFFLIVTTLDGNNLTGIIIIILLLATLSLLLFLTQKSIKNIYILPLLSFALLIGHFSVLSNTKTSFSSGYITTYQEKNTKNKKLSKAEKDAEYGFFIETADLNNAFFWTQDKSLSIATSFYILGRYLKNFFIPNPLIYFYGYNQIPLVNFTNWQTLLSLLIYILLIASVLYYLYRQPAIAFSALFYLVSISLYSQLIFYVPDTMADRYFFTSSLALSLFTILLLGHLLKIDFKNHKGSFFSSNNKIYLSIFMLIFIIILPSYSYATKERNKAWKNNITLFEHDLVYMENCARAHYYYANELLQTYHLIERDNRIVIAEKIAYHFSRSIEISDKSFASYINLARFYIGHRMFEQTYEVLQNFQQSYPNTFHYYHLLGSYYFYKENFYNAVEALEKAYAKAPRNDENYFLLAWSHYNNGSYEKAVQILEKAIALNYHHEMHFLTLSDIHFNYGNYDKAQKILEKFIQKHPSTIGSYEKLIFQLTERGEKKVANHYQNLLEQNIKKRK